ncbi:putative secreted hydrolase [Pseudonocardia sp. Ae168_Ps1]|nr:GDSL family lipase [Pseudonocardia sp. EC080625-04]ALL83837.1 GDSL family lipase [Pseudonocardia sp. EC080619-01]OLL72163.1 putative secreted hydrolase [Pseudonocardia sp. Ae150A_Ps1]OLL78130.1 putative secreted hydrolase [Pseudonocardia sp. Ae168_Ps1]OLL87746.1 putative secreted hydrolase [Pseudonocardia sp. Ae263_Ps1]OLL92228.1 putative secreted hydrolase [Pseudonocardia sp. Ae356_Ps1]OLM18767.1 putative secreted hydrolase [Pseudonocardia sp. Ae707_Ps1]
MRRPRPARWLAVATMTLLSSAGMGALAPAQAEAPTTFAETTMSARNLDTAPVGRYVALGDSYAAGPLVPLQTGQPAGCLRSDHNYPSVLARSAGFADFTDVSCSGATTEDMTAAQEVKLGPNPPQLDALDGSESLVTLTIGGNDIGFGEIIQECATRSSTNLLGSACKDFYTEGGDDQLAARIDDASSKVADVLSEIRDRAPAARVAVVGYPSILPDTGPGCYPVAPFSAGDTAYLRDTEKLLNGMLAEQAAEAGLDYVDTYGPTVGHDICQLPGVKWTEGLVPTSPAAPVHPNAQGMRAMAAATGAVIGVPVAAPSSQPVPAEAAAARTNG